MNRACYLDRLRVVLTALVVFHHTAITYGAPGGWYYRELPMSLSLTGVLLILFVSINQAYFMGFFFLIAGYFTPASCDRKGLAQFLKDRLIRLGIPLLAFVFLLDPLTSALLAYDRSMTGMGSFGAQLVGNLRNPGWGTGPLWFAQALLIFAAGYAIWRVAAGKEQRQVGAPLPAWPAWLLSAVGVGVVALLLRQWVPVGKNVSGLQIGYFSSYIFLFVLGTVAWQRNWFERLAWKMARPWMVVSILMWPVIVITIFIAQQVTGSNPEVNTGFSVPAIVYALWEPLIAWGIIAALLLAFREWGNRPSAAWEFLAARAYAVYIVHAPVLVAIALLLQGWHGPALAKIAVTGTLAVCGSLLVASGLILVPGARRII